MVQQVGQQDVVNAMDICGKFLEFGNTGGEDSRILHLHSIQGNDFKVVSLTAADMKYSIIFTSCVAQF